KKTSMVTSCWMVQARWISGFLTNSIRLSTAGGGHRLSGAGGSGPGIRRSLQRFAAARGGEPAQSARKGKGVPNASVPGAIERGGADEPGSLHEDFRGQPAQARSGRGAFRLLRRNLDRRAE